MATTLDYRMQQRSDTLANWESEDPILLAGEIGNVTDEDYYVIGDGSTAFTSITTRYRNDTIPSVGDNDISSADSTYDLANVDSKSTGYKFKVSWHSGDGSNTFSFVGTTETIDGVLYDQYIGYGTGILILEKTGDKTFQNIGPDIWDSDGGNFTGTFEKHLSGLINETRPEDKNPGGSSASGSIYRSTNDFGDLSYPVSLAVLISDNMEIVTPNSSSQWCGRKATNNATLTNWATYYILDSGTFTTTTISVVYKVTGRWTTTYPRRT
jgi:hypothetical protein